LPSRRSRTSPAAFGTARWRDTDGPLIAKRLASWPAASSPSVQSRQTSRSRLSR
jgi:hypothetical protein